MYVVEIRDANKVRLKGLTGKVKTVYSIGIEKSACLNSWKIAINLKHQNPMRKIHQNGGRPVRMAWSTLKVVE